MKENISADLKGAMKAGDKQKTSVLRMVLSEILAGEKATKVVPAEDAVRAYRRKLEKAKDEISAQAGHDPAKVADLGSEIDIVQTYLPKEATKDEVSAFLRTLDLTQPFGNVMKLTKEKFPKDGKLVSDTLKEIQGGA